MRQILILSLFSFLFAGLPEYYYKLPLKKQKIEFQKILLPIIIKENNKILATREYIKYLFNKRNLTSQEKANLKQIAKEYKIKNIKNQKEFLIKIDYIPIKLVLAQAVIESGWGRSYFAKKANNIFGQWDYSGKGLVPKNRDKNKTHTIRIFSSIDESVKVYMRNLNRNPAYYKFRKLRYLARKNNKYYSSFKAAETLILYSQLRDKYVKILKNIINQLNRYNIHKLVDNELLFRYRFLLKLSYIDEYPYKLNKIDERIY